MGERGIGWKGVGVGEAFGAAVTRVNGRAACWFAAGREGPAAGEKNPAEAECAGLSSYAMGTVGSLGA